MKLLKRAIFSMFPFTTISNTSLASLNFELETNLDDQRSTFNDCSRLIELEEKETLSSNEWTEGQLIHQLVQQINEKPLDYCLQMTSMDFLVDRQER